MIIITNRQRGPVQLIVRSRVTPRSFTVKNVPGVGSGHNVYNMPDELHTEAAPGVPVPDRLREVFKAATAPEQRLVGKERFQFWRNVGMFRQKFVPVGGFTPVNRLQIRGDRLVHPVFVR